MTGRFDSDTYFAYLEKVDEKYGFDLDIRNYETFVKRNVCLKDLPTAPNAISVAALALVMDGCKNIGTIEGVNKIGVGRGLDLFDGAVARWLDQSSDMGAIVDVTCDKLGMAAICRAAWKENAVPKPYLSYIVGKHTLHAGLTLANGYVHPEESFRPPKSGKVSMFVDNLAGGAYLYANAYEQSGDQPEVAKALKKGAHAIAAASVVSELVALPAFTRRLHS